MSNETTKTTPAGGSPLDGGVRRPGPERAKPMSYTQQQVLAKAPSEWGRLPAGHGCTSSTITALEKRGLIETTVIREQSTVQADAFWWAWRWRKTPNVL